MSTSTATRTQSTSSTSTGTLRPKTASGPRPSRARRLRRRLGFLLAVAVAAVASAATIAPWADKAVQEVKLPLRHDDIIRQQAFDKGLDPALIAGVIYAESHFRDQTSQAGAKGLMQLMPETADYIAQKSGGTAFVQGDLATPQVNISYGSWYLRYLLEKYDGGEVLALAAYNAGEGTVDDWLAGASASGERFTAADHIPFAETRHYVQRVLDARIEYRRTYPRELGL
jgi:soluble lytic murein transglycosylase